MAAETGSAAARAAEALRLAPGDTARAEAGAAEALVMARREGDWSAASTAERALGVAARARHDVGAAIRHLRSAVRLADRAGAPAVAASTRVTLSGTLAMRGDWAAALREADRAAPFLEGVEQTVLEGQRAFVLHLRGRLSEALVGYQRVLPALRRNGETLQEARVLTNVALIHAHRGALGPAEDALTTAGRLYEELGLEREAGNVHQNLGWVVARRGDMPAALAWFDQADQCFQRQGIVDAAGLQDRCEALLSARLVEEGREAAERAVVELAACGMRPRLAEARLLLAEAALLQGDFATARAEAERARRAFTRQGRRSFVALARHTALRIAWMSGERSAALLASARRTADELAAAGLATPGVDARLIAAQLAIHLGRTEVALSLLGGAGRARRQGTVELRSRAWHAEALLRLAAGDRRGAEAALRAGMGVLEAHRAALGSTDLRASASAHGADLAGLGLRMAVEEASPTRALAWAERWRAGTIGLRPVRPPDDPRLAADLAELKRIMGEAGDPAREGGSTARLVARQATLERTVRDRARRLPGVSRYSSPLPPTAAELGAALGDQALVEFVEVDGTMQAIVVVGGHRPTLHRLCPLGDVSSELDPVRFALRRLAFSRGSDGSLAAAAAGLAHGGRRLDELLMAPLVSAVGDRPLVIVPTGVVQALPWTVLPSCIRRPVVVAPSAALWLRAVVDQTASPARRASVRLVAGPGLAQAEVEIAELAIRYPRARRLTGPEATVASVLRALDGADLAHVAAHGRFRADNPLFSCLQLFDGPLTVYDLEGLKLAPRTLVLSACDSGVSDVRSGDELIGLAAALFSLGTRTLVASLLPVSDTATRDLMVALHAGLAKRLTPAAALAHAQGTVAGQGYEHLAAAASFVCLGTG